ncbi:putative thiamine biosynthesis oxidoreductase ThiO [Arthrobacter globiformis NBRC 12137]|uniref:glycine oxidase n=1 Tax=Arthrobacter globiformis (strain ATCC 8010 / DSM 20124 / JCM 1332 / NBRC 12137 / NCIMB 8907 / NRRL B-2979 / 168) TaxID=1077972 RepID=H0QS33_ARTG1|nr:glycine oxidase ThiO [Arthrobacter globiformis]GAB15519.1 putative thiamine biosynthesis oxidoreductase ThiO [Arthrobacter globiformis NBRC 12137]
MNPGTNGEECAATGLEADVAVIGGGVVGHGIAWEARRSGRSVVLIDEAPGSGASWAAAGMLAPVSELHYQEEGLLELMLESSARWPEFAATLTAGEDAGYLTTPTLAVGADPADRRALMDLRDVQRTHGLEVEPLTIREARSREPLISPAISCALDIPADHQVDPRKLVRAIADGLAGHGQEIAAAGGYAVREHAAGLLWDGGRVCGVRLAGGGSVRAAETVVASGLAAARLQNLPEGLHLPLRPVYGDILRLRVPAHLQPLLTATVRGMVRGVPVYIVPRQDGTVVIGATQREDGVPGTSAGGVYQLLRDAQVLLPAVAELELLEATARARPGTPDNAPLLGRVPARGQVPGTDVAGLIIATGFFRHGVLLTPAAAAICRQLMDGIADPRWAAFRPGRFSAGLEDPVGASAALSH